MSEQKTKGKGWFGNSAAHAAAGKLGGQKSGGNFKNNPERAAAAGRIGGKVSSGNFKNSPTRARLAGLRSAESYQERRQRNV